jgi:hypothetical protein
VADREILVRVVVDLPARVSRYEIQELAFRLDEATLATVSVENTEPGISNSGQPTLAVTWRGPVPEEWITVLTDVAEGRWPAGFVAGEPNQYLFDFYPVGLQDFCIRERERLRRRAEDALGLIRWRWARDMDPGAALGTSQFLWATEGRDWERVRMRWTIEASLSPQLTLSSKVGAVLETLALGGEAEPAGREIWHVAVKADDRTAIVLAVTAVEVELKRLLAHFAPDTQWLLENLQAPPIVRMIEEYLPGLAGVSQQTRPPEEVLRVLRRAVKYRNTVVHVGPGSTSRWITAAEPSPLTRSDVIDATSDLLWLFDSYRGHAWALDYLTPSTRRLLGMPTPEDPGPRVFRIPPPTGE